MCGASLTSLTLLGRELHRNDCLDAVDEDWQTQRCTHELADANACNDEDDEDNIGARVSAYVRVSGCQMCACLLKRGTVGFADVHHH